jgi:hypothetical protein
MKAETLEEMGKIGKPLYINILLPTVYGRTYSLLSMYLLSGRESYRFRMSRSKLASCHDVLTRTKHDFTRQRI